MNAAPNLYVFAPDLIGGALIDPAARRVLECWRDGEYKAVFSDQLLLMHLRVLARLGLPEQLVKRWSYWFTAAGTAVHVAGGGGGSAVEVCEMLAEQRGVLGIICWQKPESVNLSWKTAAEMKLG